MSTGHIKNASGTVATGGTAQDALPVDAGRQYLLIQNPKAAAETLYVDFGLNAAAATAIGLEPGESLKFENKFVPTDRVSVNAATSAHAFVLKWA